MLKIHLPLPLAEELMDSLIAKLDGDITLRHAEDQIISREDRIGGAITYAERGTRALLIKGGRGWMDSSGTTEAVIPGDLMIWNNPTQVSVRPSTAGFWVRDLLTQALDVSEMRLHFEQRNLDT